jgi:hypothetical protein
MIISIAYILGEYGIVYRGFLKHHGTELVAVKTLKG